MDAGGTLSASVLASAFDALLFVSTALLAAAVFAEALRADRPFYAALAWSVGVLYLPHVFLPLYVVYVLWRRPAINRRVFARWGVPPAILLLVTLAVGFYFFRKDRNSFDAHVERAGGARLRGRRDEAIDEYRAALRLHPDDAHTRKLLGLELSDARRWPEALEQLRAARDGGDDDAALDFHLGRALEESRRAAEAERSYQEFLRGELCAGDVPDARCQTARERLTIMKN